MKEKPQSYQKNNETQNNEIIPMRISEKGAQHLMVTLTNLYVDPIRAIIREYSSNAYDSHIKARQTKPIEINYTHTYNPHQKKVDHNIIFKDHGVGLSYDEIINVYSLYGESTKKDTNDEIGFYGLGAKSALALAKKYTIETIKNGEYIKAESYLNELNTPVIEVLERKPTTEPNGVTITIPYEEKTRTTKIDSIISEMFFGYRPETVLINDKHPLYTVHSDKELTKIELLGNTIGWVNKNEGVSHFSYQAMKNTNFTILIGPNVYKINLQKLVEKDIVRKEDLPLIQYFILNINIGTLDLTPAREEIAFTTRTIENLRQAINTITDETLNQITDSINFSTPQEAIKEYALNYETISALNAYITKTSYTTETPFYYNKINLNPTMSDKEHNYLYETKILQNNDQEVPFYNNSIAAVIKSIYNKNNISLIRPNAKPNWVSVNNRKSYSKFEGYGTNDTNIIIFPYPLPEDQVENGSLIYWLQQLFQPVEKTEFIRKAKEQQKIDSKKPTRKMFYFLADFDNKTITKTPYLDVPDNPIIMKDRNNNELLNIGETQSLNFNTNLENMNNFLKYLGIPKNNIVLLGSKSLDFAKKKLNNPILYEDIVLDAYKKLSREEKISVSFMAQLRDNSYQYNYTPFIYVKQVCEKIIENNELHKINHSLTRTMIEVFANDNKKALYKTLSEEVKHKFRNSYIASTRNNNETSTQIDENTNSYINFVDVYDFNKIYPYFNSSIYHKKQTIAYLNTIDPEEEKNEKRNVYIKYSTF